MSEQLFAFDEGTRAECEFVGFGDELPPAQRRGHEQPEPPKKISRRASRKKPRRRAHILRVAFDDREFLRLTGRAGAKGVSLDEYVKAQALRDPRVRARSAGPSDQDLFAPAPPPPRVAIPPAKRELSPELSERIDTYFTAEPRFSAGLPVPVYKTRRLRPQAPRLAKLGHFLADLVAARWYRAVPRGGA